MKKKIKKFDINRKINYSIRFKTMIKKQFNIDQLSKNQNQTLKEFQLSKNGSIFK